MPDEAPEQKVVLLGDATAKVKVAQNLCLVRSVHGTEDIRFARGAHRRPDPSAEGHGVPA
jgi:hypothetical protein